MSCKDVFTEEERKHLEEVLHGDLDGFFEEVKDTIKTTDDDFFKWKRKSNSILDKCQLNKWDIPKIEPGKPDIVKLISEKRIEKRRGI